MSEFDFKIPSEYIGCFVFDTGGEYGEFRYMMRRKPRWLTRLMVKWLFELEWRDE